MRKRYPATGYGHGVRTEEAPEQQARLGCSTQGGKNTSGKTINNSNANRKKNV